MNYFITAIGTDSGKTVVSAIVCEALQADYWKPIQAGTPKDSDTVRSLLSNTKSVIHPERWALKTPASPHAAARVENSVISIDDFSLPQTQNRLVIEGAGGCLVPMNDSHFMIDLALKFQSQVILVSNFYLGSINHTLLTIEALKSRQVKIDGIIFNGKVNEESERIIMHHAELPCLLKIDQEREMNKELIRHYSTQFHEYRN